MALPVASLARIPIVLELPTAHVSLGEPPYAKPFARERTLLTWAAKRFRRWQGISRLVLGATDEQLLGAAGGATALFDTTSRKSGTRFAFYRDCLAEAPEGAVAFVALESAWCPENIITSLLTALSADTPASCAFASDLPPGLTPFVATSSLLPLLQDLEGLALPDDVYSRPFATTVALLRRTGVEIAVASAPVRNGEGQAARALAFDASFATKDGWRVAERVAMHTDRERTSESSLPLLQQRWEQRRQALRRWSRSFATHASTSPGLKGATRTTGRPLRVLYVSNPSAVSGPEQNLRDLVRHLDRHEVESFGLIALEGLFSRWLRDEGVRVWCPERDFAEQTADNYRIVAGAVRRMRPDVIHANAFSGWPILAAAALEDVPYIHHARVLPYPASVAACDAAHTVIAETEFVRDEYIKAGCPAQKIVVVPSGVDCAHFRPGAVVSTMRRTLGIPEDAFLVLMIARCVRWKRHDLLLEAFASLGAHRRGMYMLLVGGDDREDPVFYSQIMRLKTAAGLDDCVMTVPFVSDIRQALAAADVVVLPSDGEPSGRATVEAMAMGVPVIACSHGGHKEAVGLGGGFLVPPGDPLAIASCLLSLRDDPFMRRRIGEEGSAAVRAAFAAERVNERIMRLYQQVIARPAPARLEAF